MLDARKLLIEIGPSARGDEDVLRAEHAVFVHDPHLMRALKHRAGFHHHVTPALACPLA